MEAAMAAIFPKGIRALMVDDDNRFVRSASTLLSVLNFKVVTCSTVAHALKSLSTLQLKDMDVVLVHAAKAAACGFNFRAIVETDLGIPVIYFLPLDHRATGDEAEELLSTLEAGTYIMPTPLDIDEVRSRLWRVIAWRKYALDRRPPAAGGGGIEEGDDDEGRVHYKVVRCRKRKGGNSNTGEGSAGAGAERGSAPPPAGKGKEKVVEGNYQQQPAQQKKCRGRKSKKSSGEAFKPQPPPFQLNFKQPSKTLHSPPPVRQPPGPSQFVDSVPKTFKVPPRNIKFFSHDPGTSNTAAAFAGASSNAAQPPPRPPLFSAAKPPARTQAARHQQQQQPPVHNLVFGNVASSVAAAAAIAAADEPPQPSSDIANQQQQPAAAHKVIFGNVAPPPAATAMDAATATSAAARRSQQLQDTQPLLMFGALGPFPYQGSQPQPHVAPQDMVAPATATAPAGGVFTGAMAGGGSAAGASSATRAGAYCNDESSSFLQPQSFDMDMHTDWVEPPEHVVFNASHEEAMMESLFNDINNHGPSGSPLVATDDQVLGMASNVSGPTMAGGEFGSWDAAPASFIAPQDLRAELNAGGSGSINHAPFMAPHQDLIGAAPNGGNRDIALSMESHQDLGAAMDGNVGLMADMLSSDQYGDDDTSFPLDALLDGLPSPLLFADLDGGAATGGAAGDSLIGREEEEGGNMNDLEGLNGLEIPYDVFQLDEFMFPPQQNNKNKNNGRK